MYIPGEMNKHLAVFRKESIKKIFLGKRLVEVRFSQKKIPPFGVINRRDIVYIKPPGEDIVGQFIVKKVIFFDGIDEKDWKMISSLSKDSASKNQSLIKYATIIFLDQVEQFITSPIKIKKTDSRGWVVL